MPNNTQEKAEISQLAKDDYNELELAHDNKTDESQNISLEDAFKNQKLRALIKQVINSKTNRSGIMPFLAAVELDLERRNPIGLKELFILWLENGNKYWLNPMDKSNGLGVLEEILFKYQGDVKVLIPIVQLLIQLAKDGISPRSFVEYVILPRLRNDYDWRKWQERHLEALKIIADLVTKAGHQPPFNQTHLGSGKTRLARDIVLVRYIGRPLAQFAVVQLRETSMLDSYKEAWRKISLQNPLSLYFMRNNALHFIYSMSGRIDLIQLVAIVEQLPDIERAFTSTFSDGNIKLKKIQAINLYDYDIDISLQQRKRKGFASLDYAIEIKAYYSIVKALLEKPTGVYLLAWYAGLLKSYKNPVIAENLSQLVKTVDDRGGMHIYKWHTEKLLDRNKIDMQAYIEFLAANRGCDPDYPLINLLFRDEENARHAQDVVNMAEYYGLQEYFIGWEQKSFSYKDILTAYLQKCPGNEKLIKEYQDDLVTGKDRQWTGEFLEKLDEIKINDKILYKPLLRSVIRGIGMGYSVGEKGGSFHYLIEKYGGVNSLKEIKARTQFIMKVKPVLKTSADQDAAARKQINLELIERVWTSLHNTEQLNINNAVSFINKWSMELNEPLDKSYENKISLEESLKELPEDDDFTKDKRLKIQKDISKQDKAIEVLQKKKEDYSAVLDSFDSLNNEERFITTLILAGASGKEDAEFLAFASSLLLQKYKEVESIKQRLEFLADDVSVDVITYQQFVYLLNLLETLFFVLREDEKIAELLKKDEEKEEESILQQILTPYIITKKKVITIDSLEAAAKKMTSYAAMQGERAKWQSIIEDQSNEKEDKYNHKMEIYTSKSFIDAHYGDMGGICLSGHPDQITRPNFFIQRLADYTDNQIIGMSILFLSTKGFSSTRVTARNFWHAFGFNPLYSVLCHLTTEQQLNLYLHFRLNIEKIAWMSKMPVVLSGIETFQGLISNNGSFGDLIRKYELSKPTAKRVSNAKGLSLYYDEKEYAKALVIIDPRGFEDIEDISKVPTFYAMRELNNGVSKEH